jgi:hypothetical protein
VDVDTAYASPGYGNIHAYQQSLAPPTNLRNISYVQEINQTRYKEMLLEMYTNPVTCKDLD